MSILLKNTATGTFSKNRDRLFATLPLIFVVLLAAWMGWAGEAGYSTEDWAPAAFVLAALFLVASATGWLWGARSRWGALAIALFAAYTAWTFASLLWSPNQGDAWRGAGQTLLYLLAFWVAVGLLASGASRRWVLLATVLGPSAVALITLANLSSNLQYFFADDRLYGTARYYNGEAAFLLVPFWVAMYLGGSRRVNPALRALVLGGAVLCVSVAVLTQSRGAMVAMAVSVPVFFALSGQRLRGFLALIPVVAALIVTFPGLNGVYLAFLDDGDPAAALERVTPTVWLCATGAGLYGLLWGLADRWWRSPDGVVRAAGGVVLAGCVAALVFGAFALTDRVGDPVAWGQQKWEAFKTDDVSGMEESRYLSASGSGRYTLWEVAWEDFERHPVLGVGTYNYEATYYQLRDQYQGYIRQPHSLPLEVLAERGIVGGALFFGFLATCLAAGLWQRFRRLNAEGKAQVGAATAAVAYWFVHSSAEWFWQLPAITLPAIVYLSVLVAPWRRRSGEEAAPTGWPLRAAGAVVAVAAVAAIAPLYIADLYLQSTRTAEGPRVALQTAERAQSINPVDYWAARQEAELALFSGAWVRAEESYRRAIRLNPEHYEPYYQLGQLKEGLGAREEALSLYRKAHSLNPLDEQIEERMTQLEGKPTDGGPESPPNDDPDGSGN